MKVTVNGKVVELRQGMTVLEYLREKKVNPDGVIVVYNSDVLNREDWDATVLKEEDTVEILTMMGGG
ncbi:thiamine biosynthesis protein ThiS [Calderihabitans maritimus]|uniref:Thiamine biosynthesis protein ThiS n=1 Tax=Calderihabitans maritimus TaxID=1246530 RepID=A0A1Z5HX74_9FIRM|nr:thiamine biosynthesis protein ThiS [Calderihabitans maritimus]